MVRHETAREQFRCAFRRAQRAQLIRVTVLQHKNRIQRRVRRLGNASVAVPRRAVHLNAAVFLAQNDAVVAQHARSAMLCPQAAPRCFSPLPNGP